jgi:hypothetical protein
MRRALETLASYGDFQRIEQKLMSFAKIKVAVGPAVETGARAGVRGMSGSTFFDKNWSAHKAGDLPKGHAALVIDRVTLPEISGGYALRDMLHAGERPRLWPDQVLAVAGPVLRGIRFPAAAPERGNGASSTRLSFRSPRADEGALTAWLVWRQISSGRMELAIRRCRLQRSSWHVKIFRVSGALYRSECPWARTSARN